MSALKSDTPWVEGWETALRATLERRGYSSLSEYMAKHPGVTYVRIGEALGGFAALQVQRIQLDEAVATDSLRKTAMDALVRIIRDRLKHGWDVGQNSEYIRASAFAAWDSFFSLGVRCCSFSLRTESVWNALEHICPPKRWLPESPSDAIITEAFALGWEDPDRIWE